MTQQEIQERNEQTALMLGAIYSIHAEAWGFGNARIEPNELKFDNKIIKGAVWAQRFEKELKFNSDWNWLMEAVEFIENLDLNDIFTMPEFNYYVGKMTLVRVNKDVLKKMPITSKKEAVFIAVSDFAKLYNNKEL